MNKTSGIRSINRVNNTRFKKVTSRVVGRDAEKGYVMVMTAILLPLLLVLVSAATDITYFYARNVEIQRIADSAALSGVVRMPNFPDAKKHARLVATQNGAKSNVNNMTVTVDQITGSNRQIKVTVRDANVKLFFGQIFKDHWDITRTATAEYVSNIPLGSVLNQIGTGNLSGTGAAPGSVGAGLRPTSQNFWLTVQGPCAAKEQGDRVSTRWDGTWFNWNRDPSAFPPNTDANAYRRICDYPDSGDPRDPVAQRTQIAQEQAMAPNGLFPAVSANRDYEAEGYNYIVDVPCLSGPAPCPAGEGTSSAVNIDVFDPVFGPDSLQTQGNPTTKIKPDSYGVLRIGTPGCNPTATGQGTGTVIIAGVNACRSIVEVPDSAILHTSAGGKVRPSDVRVTTEFRVYAADSTPMDPTDDHLLALPLLETDAVSQGTNDDKLPAPNNSVATFKSCINATDWWMNNANQQALDANHDYIPDGFASAKVEVPIISKGAQDPLDAHCDRNSVQWRTLLSLPVGSQTGRYRVNVRSVSAPFSFGMNAFSLRASYGATPPPNGVGTFTWCHGITPNTCPSVSGDSTMAVSASVPAVSEFYLAQLSPAKLFRGKTIVLQLWDVGEGGNKIELLRPVSGNSQCVSPAVPETVSDPVVGIYCPQNFNWSVKDPNLTALDSSATLTSGSSALNSDIGNPMGDNCSGSGKENELSLTVSGDWDNSLKTPNVTANCKSSFPLTILNSRAGFGSSYFPVPSGVTASGVCANTGDPTEVKCDAGKFNDRLVSLEVQVPATYGCKEGTGNSPTVPCDESAPFVLPQNGWWKIRYTPLTASATQPCTQTNSSGCLPMTDATTWSVNLIGDPVHLIQNG
jgi:hypothetical protein